jgi:hypothetical protein
MEVDVGPVGFSVEQQNLIWAMWRRGDAIRAHGNPAKLQPYEQPKPYEIRWDRADLADMTSGSSISTMTRRRQSPSADGWE